MKYTFILFLNFFVMLSACSSTRELSEDGSEKDAPLLPVDEQIAEEYLRNELDEFERVLYDSRSYMSDHFSQIEQKIPEQFLKEVVREEKETNEFAGFRVQILSTRNVAEADSTTDELRTWASEELPDYNPETYTVFRQPYYRVRVGNFKIRDNAIEFSRLLKYRYPDAWVVHDRIDPQNLTIKKVENEESASERTDNGSDSI